MTDFEKLALLRHALETILILLADDSIPNRLSRCEALANSALRQTSLPVSKERTVIPGINDQDFVRIFKS